jgi:hypothetical protein
MAAEVERPPLLAHGCRDAQGIPLADVARVLGGQEHASEDIVVEDVEEGNEELRGVGDEDVGDEGEAGGDGDKCVDTYCAEAGWPAAPFYALDEEGEGTESDYYHTGKVKVGKEDRVCLGYGVLTGGMRQSSDVRLPHGTSGADGLSIFSASLRYSPASSLESCCERQRPKWGLWPPCEDLACQGTRQWYRPLSPTG